MSLAPAMHSDILTETYSKYHVVLRRYIRARVADADVASDLAAGVWERMAAAVLALFGI